MTDLICTDDHRRDDVRAAPLYGLDYVEVTTADQRTLEVFFLGRAPQKIDQANVRITGGRRIRDIQVDDIRVHRAEDPTLDDYLEVDVAEAGDASEYVLSLVKLDDEKRPTDEPMTGFDPHFASVRFTFKAGCPTDLDCKPTSECPPEPRPDPDINYLAKDYASFRQLLLDRLALTMPQWRDRHVPDIGIMIVELLAYVGDHLSYYQDAVATEAYLGTARQRISVRRHARLVGYRMHEGSNARAFVTIATDADASLDAREIFFTTPLPGRSETHYAQAEELERIAPASYHVFEPLVRDRTAPIRIYKRHTEIHFYTWGDCECCLPRGATRATLIDAWLPAPAPPADGATPQKRKNHKGKDQTSKDQKGKDQKGKEYSDYPEQPAEDPATKPRVLNLAVGDVLIFEEVLGPCTGNPADADPAHRQAVRLTKVTPAIDPLYHPEGSDHGQPVVEIEWCAEDALTFALTISAKMPPPDCDCREHISVARGNVILVDHGVTTEEKPLGTVPVGSTKDHCACECEPPRTETIPADFCPVLDGRPLTHAQPLPPCGCAVRLLVQDPRQALPQVLLTGTEDTPHGPLATSWTPVPDLLDSHPHDPHFVVETDDDGRAHLRFGDGDLGRKPAVGTVFDARYRVGNGAAGHVGAESITTIVFRQVTGNAGALVPRNPLPAVGGIDPEPVEEVKAYAPHAFRSLLWRAVIADDYAALASDSARRFAERPALQTEGDGCNAAFQTLQRAKATLRWTGAWNEVFVAIDPHGSQEAGDDLLAEVDAYLEPYRRIGHDVEVKRAQYVGLELALRVCLLPGYLRGHVKAALFDVFSSRTRPDGTRGFFHPDNLTFGQGIYVSRIIAAAQAVTGVQQVEVLRLTRAAIGASLAAGQQAVPAHGVLPLGPFEIARLDNDPNLPEHGRLILELGGGR